VAAGEFDESDVICIEDQPSERSSSPVGKKKIKKTKKITKRSKERAAIIKHARGLLDISAECSSDASEDEDEFSDLTCNSFIDDGSQPMREPETQVPKSATKPTKKKSRKKLDESVSFYHQFMIESPEDQRLAPLGRSKFKMVYNKATPPSQGFQSSFSNDEDYEDEEAWSASEPDNIDESKDISGIQELEENVDAFDEGAKRVIPSTPENVIVSQQRQQSQIQQASQDKIKKALFRSLSNMQETSHTKTAAVPTASVKATSTLTGKGDINAEIDDFDDIGLLGLLDEDFSDDDAIQKVPSPVRTRALVQPVPVVPVSSTKVDPSKSLALLIDNTAVTSMGNVVSHLRRSCGYIMYFLQLSICKFVVSPRMAVERFTQSNLVDRFTRTQLGHLHTLKSMYPESIVIVEKEREKGVNTIDRFASNKTYENALAAVARLRLVLLFSETQDETAQIIESCVSNEAEAGHCITNSWPKSMTDQQEKVWRSVFFFVKFIGPGL
jgi:hypothetical protein